MTKSSKIILISVMMVILISLVAYCVFFGNTTVRSAVLTSDTVNQSSVDSVLAEAQTLALKAETAVEQGNIISVLLSDGTASSDSVEFEDNVITITSTGIYQISGTLSDGQIVVDTKDDVTLILNGIYISNTADSAINIINAGHVLIYLPDGSENYVLSGIEQEISDSDDSETVAEAEGAALYAKDNLSIAGEGLLNVGGYINNGIATTDRLTMLSGTIQIDAVNNGLKGKDSVLIMDGSLYITSGGDGIKSNNDDGTVDIRGGTINLSTYGDGIQAAKNLTVSDGIFTINSGTVDGASVSSKSDQDWSSDFAGFSVDDVFSGIDGITENSDGSITVSTEAAEKIYSMAIELLGETSVTVKDIATCSSYDDLISLFSDEFDLQMPDNINNMPDNGMFQSKFGEQEQTTKQDSNSTGVIGDEYVQDPPEKSSGDTNQMNPGNQFDGGNDQMMPSNHQGGSHGGGINQQQPERDDNYREETVDTQDHIPSGDFADFFDRDNDGDSSGSNKGLKSDGDLNISGGTFSITSEDDCLHADGSMSLIGGSFVLVSGDDGIHAETTLTLDGADITINQSYEGIESHCIYVQSGTISVTASDDGFNANGGSSIFGAMFDNNDSTDESTPILQITGGTVYVNAGGDGLDSNGDLLVEGGYVIVDGPSDSGNGALDSGTENGGMILCNGGTVLAIGGSGMAESFENDSQQPSFIYNFSEKLESGCQIVICDEAGSVLLEHTSAKAFNSIVFSSPDLKKGSNIILKVGDQSVSISIDDITNGNSSGSGMAGGFGNMGGSRK